MQTYDHFADFPCNSAEFSQSDKKVPPFNRKGQGLISEYYFPSSRHTKGFLNLVFVATRYQIFQHPGSPWSVLGQHVFFWSLENFLEGSAFPGRLGVFGFARTSDFWSLRVKDIHGPKKMIHHEG